MSSTIPNVPCASPERLFLLSLSKWLHFCHRGHLPQELAGSIKSLSRTGLRQCLAEQGMEWRVTEVLTGAQKQRGWCGRAVEAGEAVGQK